MKVFVSVIEVNVGVNTDILIRTRTARRAGGTLAIRVAGRRYPSNTERGTDADTEAEAAIVDPPITAWLGAITGVRTLNDPGATCTAGAPALPARISYSCILGPDTEGLGTDNEIGWSAYVLAPSPYCCAEYRPRLTDPYPNTCSGCGCTSPSPPSSGSEFPTFGNSTQKCWPLTAVLRERCRVFSDKREDSGCFKWLDLLALREYKSGCFAPLWGVLPSALVQGVWVAVDLTTNRRPVRWFVGKRKGEKPEKKEQSQSSNIRERKETKKKNSRTNSPYCNSRTYI